MLQELRKIAILQLGCCKKNVFGPHINLCVIKDVIEGYWLNWLIDHPTQKDMNLDLYPSSNSSRCVSRSSQSTSPSATEEPTILCGAKKGFWSKKASHISLIGRKMGLSGEGRKMRRKMATPTEFEVKSWEIKSWEIVTILRWFYACKGR